MSLCQCTQQIIGRKHHWKNGVVLQQPVFIYKYWDVKQRNFCSLKKKTLQKNHIILLVLFSFIWKQRQSLSKLGSYLIALSTNPLIWSWRLFYHHYGEVSSSLAADFNLNMKYGLISELWNGMIDTASNMVLESGIWKHY